MHAQAFSGHVLDHQIEGLACISNHQAWTVDGHHQHGQVIQRRRLARTCGAEHHHMGVLLTVNLVEWVDPQRLAAAIPEPKAWVGRAA